MDAPPNVRGWIAGIRDGGIVLLFALGIGIPLCVTVAGTRTGGTVLGENRSATEAPALRMAVGSFGQFTRQFEAFFGDAFAFRGRLLRWHGLVKACWLGVSPSERVVVGTHGWLYYRGEDAMEDYRATRPLGADELTRWIEVLMTRDAWLAQRGVRYLVVVAPNTQTIYPEYLPEVFNRVGTTSRLDQVAAALAARGFESLVDPRAGLFAAKLHERVYRMADSHWNDRGVFVAYEGIVRALARWYPALHPRGREGFDEVVFPWRGGDLAGMIGLPDVFREEAVLLRPREPYRARPAAAGIVGAPAPPGAARPTARETGNPTLPRAVMLHDSFGLGLFPFLSEHFERILYLPTHDLAMADIERERPDVVIDQFVERALMQPPPRNLSAGS